MAIQANSIWWAGAAPIFLVMGQYWYGVAYRYLRYAESTHACGGWEYEQRKEQQAAAQHARAALKAYAAITGNPCTQFAGEMKGDAWFITSRASTAGRRRAHPERCRQGAAKSMVGRVIEQAENARKQAREVEDRLRAMGHTKSRKSRKKDQAGSW